RRPHPGDGGRPHRRHARAQRGRRVPARPLDGRHRRMTGRSLDSLLLPALNLLLALLLSGAIVLLLGEDPLAALAILIAGAFGDAESLCYTLYYATSFLFGGLAVALALHGGLLNIGGEGQATLGGLAVALLCLALPG